jgi:hypothetical protein
MKNIHILSTDQPSRLWINNLLQGKLELSKETLIGSNTAQHMYIASDEEIKEGDWFITKTNDVVLKVQKPEKSYDPIGEKIILTTDPKLIADGIQAIDDEFLEWFVKNPTCEYVEVKKQYITPLGDIVDTCYDNERLNYKIIIPQEEIFLKDISLTSSIGSIQFVQPIQMSWKPKEDITAYELALCIPYIIRFNIMPFEIDQSLPHFRHFEIINPNK